MKYVPFTKATACGNDFILVESARVEGDQGEFTRRICDRHDGVGADGVEWMAPSSVADLEIHLINADGSVAEISGNGTRCVAAFWSADKRMDRVTIQTDAGPRVCHRVRRTGAGFECKEAGLELEGAEFEFETEMGAATVGESLALALRDGPVQGIPVATGNPHYVIFAEAFPADWQRQAQEIGAHPQFPWGVNVEWVRVRGEREIEIRIYERGAGETLSSGTGSCAAAIAAIATGRAQSPVRVTSPGGAQTVRWENGAIMLRGPARIICRGEFLWTQ